MKYPKISGALLWLIAILCLANVLISFISINTMDNIETTLVKILISIDDETTKHTQYEILKETNERKTYVETDTNCVDEPLGPAAETTQTYTGGKWTF